MPQKDCGSAEVRQKCPQTVDEGYLLTGGQETAGSSPVTQTKKNLGIVEIPRFFYF
jgi:hypothetical protein